MTRIQYRNWIMPESIIKTRKASMSLSLGDVVVLYDSHSDCTATLRAVGFVEDAPEPFEEDILSFSAEVLLRDVTWYSNGFVAVHFLK